MDKTNAMRILDKEGISYKIYEVDPQLIKDGESHAILLNKDKGEVFKTLVTKGKSGEYFVFMVSVGKSLDLKKCAKSVNEKEIEMIEQKKLFPLTGYVHLGCSPLGMKKQFKTVIDEEAILYDTIIFSGGRIGLSLELKREDLEKVIPIEYFDISRE